LAELAGCNQIVEHAPGRFTLHDLLRAYSVDLASTVDSAEERAAAREERGLELAAGLIEYLRNLI
jgi:hypothetical protein